MPSTRYISIVTNSLPSLEDAAERERISSGDKRQRWVEVCIVMLLAFSSSLVGSLSALKSGPGAATQLSNSRMVVGFIHEVTCLLLLGYVLSRRSLHFRNLGLEWRLRDVGVGLWLALGSYLAYWLGSVVIYLIHHAIYAAPATAHSSKDIFGTAGVAAIPFTLVNPFFEELIVRAYLMTEIKDLTGSTMLAIASSVVLQGSYHLYYGWSIALSLSFQFLIFAIYYAIKRRALPLIVAHGAFDIYGVFRLW
jgi:membrane protease YdiL (CAAX protease family)